MSLSVDVTAELKQLRREVLELRQSLRLALERAAVAEHRARRPRLGIIGCGVASGYGRATAATVRGRR